ncbi:MAG: hypothetical protein M3R00_00740 [Pseudomonadota bacterium]|nr:hypothetical protein [Pseudomonadota bacterium]
MKDLSENSLEQFLDALQKSRQIALGKGVEDTAFIQFRDNIAEPLSWEGVLSAVNNENENILHLLALITDNDEIIELLDESTHQSQIEQLVKGVDDKGYTPFHSVSAKYNLRLFEYIVTQVKLNTLVSLAADVDLNRGYNSFDLLCVAAYNEQITEFQSEVERMETFPEIPSKEFPQSNIEISEDILTMMSRYRELFPKQILSLALATDLYSNDALKLCFYTRNAKLIEACLNVFTDPKDMLKAITTPLHVDTEMTPLRFLCAFCDEGLIKIICARLDSHKILEESVRINGKSPSILWRSLCYDGAIINYLLEKPKHLSCNYELLCELMFYVYGTKSNSPRQHSVAMFKPANALNAASIVLGKALLVKLFKKMIWPDDILQLVGESIVAELKTVLHVTKNAKLALMNIMTSSKLLFVSIPIALLYQLKKNDQKEYVLGKLEQTYVDSFKDELVIKNLQAFYKSLKVKGNGAALAHEFLMNVFRSQSILRYAMRASLKFTSENQRDIGERFVKVVDEQLDPPLKPSPAKK